MLSSSQLARNQEASAPSEVGAEQCLSANTAEAALPVAQLQPEGTEPRPDTPRPTAAAFRKLREIYRRRGEEHILDAAQGSPSAGRIPP